MIFRIPVGKHRARPFRPWFWWRRTHFSWVVKFDESCRYNLGNEDQFDTNKLVGIGYLWHHHKDSARFGWRYSKEKDKIEIMAYCYAGGERIIDHLGDVFINENYLLKLEVIKTGYWLSLKGPGYTAEKLYRHHHNKRLQYRLGPFFGGQSVAPHDIKIQIERV